MRYYKRRGLTPLLQAMQSMWQVAASTNEVRQAFQPVRRRQLRKAVLP